MNTVTKDNLASKVAQKTGLNVSKSLETINALIEALQEALVGKSKVEFRGFGCFIVKTRAPRTGLNPRAGETIQIPAKTVVRFKVGSHLQAALNPDAPVTACAAPTSPAPGSNT